MNNIRQINELNKHELENGVSPEASWHTDYRDTAYIYIGGLPFELSEGDIITIFSQFGEPSFINLVRDKETGKSRGFAFLKYEDQRSTDLAVDNLGGAVVMGRTLQVDHTRYKKKDEEEGQNLNTFDNVHTQSLEEKDRADGGSRKLINLGESGSESEEARPVLEEERELAVLIRDHDEDDPMKAFLIQKKKDEVEAALATLESGKRDQKDRKKKHRHHHRSRRPDMVADADEHSHSRRRTDRNQGRRLRSRERSPAWELLKESDNHKKHRSRAADRTHHDASTRNDRRSRGDREDRSRERSARHSRRDSSR